ncbi:MAG TPA: DUF4386 domain-containing protein [Hanamia sp.]|nr:DUF4386 domain-containing protein [Hanamia sp.]
MQKNVYKTNPTLRIIGTLYITASAASIAGMAILQSVTGNADYLAHLLPNRSTLVSSILLLLLNDAAVIAVGILFYGLIKTRSYISAAAILITRLVEGITLIVGKIGLLLLITIGQEYAKTGKANVVYFPVLGNLAQNWYRSAFELAMLGLGIGGFILNYFLFTNRLVPRLIALLGVIGYVLLFAKSIADMLGFDTPFSLFLPVALFELVFPLWIIIKGFKTNEGTLIP